MVEEGFRWFFERQLALVWSAPNYAYKTNNLATVMKVTDSDVEVQFFDPDPRSPEVPQLGVLLDYFA
jgi:hypothetical protein